MMMRGLAVWVLILSVAFVNGALREMLIIPRAGDAAGHAISTILLCAAILAVTWCLIGRMNPPTAGEARRIGAMWLALTVAFEFLAGHYLFGTAWSRLLADYNIFRGRIWVLVLVTTALAPSLMARGRGRPGTAA